jgi:ethanolamine ammonia-lyase small subunit
VPASYPNRPAKPLPTSARLSLGSVAPSQPTAAHLRFQLDHALARDAVHTPLDIALLQRGLIERGLQPILLHSAAPDRKTYLHRPDLGRTLHPDSISALKLGAPRLASETWVESPQPSTILFLLADGLSSLALERHALPLLDSTLPLLLTPYSLTLPLVQNARVAIADHIGSILHAQITVLLIGERPGLSSPDSLGVYITFAPRPGRTDAERNCISNIRGDAGLSYTEAAHRIAHYITEAQRLHTTGTALKDPSTSTPLL